MTGQPNEGPGLGPGGGNHNPSFGGSGGSYASLGAGSTGPLYGNVGVLSLIGGSGGGGHYIGSYSGGGGGGAFLLAAGDTLTIGGAVSANGGATTHEYQGSGSGGGVRLIADKLFGAGALTAKGGTYGPAGSGGGNGRIRVEVNQSDWAFTSSPAFTCGSPGTDPQIWLPADKPRVNMVSLGGIAIPADPRAGFTWPTGDVYLGSCTGVKTLVIQAENVPLTWHVRVRVAPINGSTATTVDATYVSGDETLSTWQADLSLGQYHTAIQVRASLN